MRQVQQLAASPPDSQRYLRSCESSRHKRSSCCSSCSRRRSGKTATSVNRCRVLQLSSQSQTRKGGVHACGRVNGKSVVQTRTCSTGGERRRTRVKGKASEDAAPTVVSEVQSLLQLLENAPLYATHGNKVVPRTRSDTPQQRRARSSTRDPPPAPRAWPSCDARLLQSWFAQLLLATTFRSLATFTRLLRWVAATFVYLNVYFKGKFHVHVKGKFFVRVAHSSSADSAQTRKPSRGRCSAVFYRGGRRRNKNMLFFFTLRSGIIKWRANHGWLCAHYAHSMSQLCALDENTIGILIA